MKRALGIWTAICLGIVVVTFLAAPGWQTEAEGWSLFSGAEIFVAVASLTVAAWIVGIGVIVGIGAVLRRVSPRAAIVILVLFLAALVLAVGVYVSGDGGETGSSFVAFNTVDGDPDWSPKGRSIAFATNRGSGGVYVVRPDGTAMRSLFRGEASDVDWSPDGKAIAFTGKGGIYVLDVRDGSARLVVRGSAFSLPAWAPNGRELAVVKEESGVYRTYNGRITATSPAVYVVRLDGGELRRLLPWYRGAVGDARPGSIAAVSETEPAWRPTERGSPSRPVTARSSPHMWRVGVASRSTGRNMATSPRGHPTVVSSHTNARAMCVSRTPTAVAMSIGLRRGVATRRGQLTRDSWSSSVTCTEAHSTARARGLSRSWMRTATTSGRSPTGLPHRPKPCR